MTKVSVICFDLLAFFSSQLPPEVSIEEALRSDLCSWYQDQPTADWLYAGRSPERLRWWLRLSCWTGEGMELLWHQKWWSEDQGSAPVLDWYWCCLWPSVSNFPPPLTATRCGQSAYWISRTCVRTQVCLWPWLHVSMTMLDPISRLRWNRESETFNMSHRLADEGHLIQPLILAAAAPLGWFCGEPHAVHAQDTHNFHEMWSAI